MNSKFLFLIVILIGLSMTKVSLAQDNAARILNIQELKSNGGIDFMLVSDHTLPIVTINFAFTGAGSINDPLDKVGLGQLVSNVIDEGAGTRDAQAYQGALQERAIELSFFNSRDHFGGKLKTLKRHQGIAMELLHDAMTSPHFEADAIERMKNANMMRVKSAVASTDWQAARLMNAVYFDGHPYAMNSGGTLSGLAAITADDMRHFVKTHFSKGNLQVAMAGDITAEEAKTLIDTVFGDLPDGVTLNVNDASNFTAQATPVKKGYETNSPQSVVQMVWPLFNKIDPDYYALRALNQVLGAGGFSSMLMDEVREKRGLTYGIYSRLSFMNYANYLSIESATSPENLAPMTVAVTDVLNSLKTVPLDADMLADAKNYLIGSLPLQFSSTQSLSSTPLSVKMDGLPLSYLDDWAENIQAVTAADVMRVANRIFVDVQPNVTVVAGAIPEGQNIELVKTLPGVE